MTTLPRAWDLDLPDLTRLGLPLPSAYSEHPANFSVLTQMRMDKTDRLPPRVMVLL